MIIYSFQFWIFHILLVFTQLHQLNGTVTQTPTFACEGDSITVNCVLIPPSLGDILLAFIPSFIIGTSNARLTSLQVNNNISHPGVDLSRLAVETPVGNTTRISATITLLSYLSSSDDGLRIGCSVVYQLNGTTTQMLLTETITLKQADPPSILSPTPTIQNFNPSTCEGNIRFNLSTMSDREYNYSIGYNGINIIASNLTSSNTELSYKSEFILNTNYPTSIIATSCAGSSSNGDASVQVNGYNQSELTCYQYNHLADTLTINWTLTNPSQPTGVSGINIEYSVGVTYSHSNGTVTYLFTNTTSTFNLVSTVTTYDVALTAHNFTNPQGVETNVSAYVRILQQCGQNVVGPELHCSISSVTSFPVSTSTPVLPSSVSSSANSTVSTTISTTASTTPISPVNIACTTSSDYGVPLSFLLLFLFLVALIIIAILIFAIIFMARKVKQLNSALTAKAAPTHGYEYIDIDEIGRNISSPTQPTEQPPTPQDYVPMSSVQKQDYVPMSSVLKQDYVTATTQYANLK